MFIKLFEANHEDREVIFATLDLLDEPNPAEVAQNKIDEIRELAGETNWVIVVF